jgi:hypothetical protein
MARPLDDSGRARTLSLLRVARLETNWVALGQGGDAEQVVAAMNRDLQALQAQSPAVGVSGLCDSIGRILAHVAAHGGVLPQELDLLMTMAIQFVGRLVRDGPAAARGIEGFLREVDEALRDAGGAPSERGGRESRSREPVGRQASRWSVDLGIAATTAFLGHLFADDAQRPRLYQSWQLLADEASRVRSQLTSRRVAVVRFRTAILPVDIAVPADWSVVAAEEPFSGSRAVDLLGACVGAPTIDAEVRQHATRLQLVRAGIEIVVHAASEPTQTAGDRLCPTSDLHPAEVILVGGTEVVLVRPDRAIAQAARSPE